MPIVKLCSDTSEDKSSNMNELVVLRQGTAFSAVYQPASWHSLCVTFQARFLTKYFLKNVAKSA
jgi:hypothetical protein